MIKEELDIVRPAEYPPYFGQTICVGSRSLPIGEVLATLKAIWKVAVLLREQADDDVAHEDPALPQWFEESFTSKEEVVEWIISAEGRDWMWWSSYVSSGTIKLDVCAFSMPNSLKPLIQAIDAAGGTVLRRGDWIAHCEDI